MAEFNTETIGSIKGIAELQGQSVGTAEIIKSIRGIGNTIADRVNQLTVKTAQSFLPVTEQIQQINQLLVSPREEDQDEAFKLIDRLQERLGLDLSKFSGQLGANINKLYELNSQQKSDKADRQEVHKQKIEELKKEREILRERGVNTIINEETYALELRTRESEKTEKTQIFEREKELQQREKDLQKEAKAIQQSDVIDKDREEQFLEDQNQLTQDQLELQDRKDDANIKEESGPRAQGFLSQSFGGAGTALKNQFEELAIIGASIGKAFKGIPQMLGSFAKGVGGLAKRFGMLMLAMLPVVLKFVIFAVLIAALVMAIVKVYNVIMDVVETIKSKVQDIKQMFTDLIDGFRNSRVGKFLGLGTEKQGPPTKEEMEEREKAKADALSRMNDYEYEDLSGQKQIDESLNTDFSNGMGFNQLSRAEDSIVQIPDFPMIKALDDPKVKLEDMKTSEKDLKVIEQDLSNLIKDDPKSNNNTIISPTTNTVSNNTTQAISMSTKNLDPSFINLDSLFAN